MNATPKFRYRRVAPWLAVALSLIACMAWLRMYLGCVVVVGESMYPTFDSGDLLVVSKSAYAETAPRRGDLVVAKFRSEFIIKRVVALPGEAVEVQDGAVRINGEPLAEGHAIQPGTLRIRRGELLQDRYAVLGDNRCETDGVLFFAVIPRERLVGKVIGTLRWPHVLRTAAGRSHDT